MAQKKRLASRRRSSIPYLKAATSSSAPSAVPTFCTDRSWNPAQVSGVRTTHRKEAKPAIGRRRKNLPKWRYDFNCRKCDNIQFIDDPRAAAWATTAWRVRVLDQGRPNPIHAGRRPRVRCDCFRPIPEPEEKNRKKVNPHDEAFSGPASCPPSRERPWC